MMNIDSAAYVALNRTAHAVWEAPESTTTASEITAKLIEVFDVAPQECRAAVSRLSQKSWTLSLPLRSVLAPDATKCADEAFFRGRMDKSVG
jgi:hypothetical protein